MQQWSHLHAARSSAAPATMHHVWVLGESVQQYTEVCQTYGIAKRMPSPETATIKRCSANSTHYTTKQGNSLQYKQYDWHNAASLCRAALILQL